MTTRVSLTELAAANIRLRPAEAVTLVSDICRQYLEGQLRGVPSPGVLRITRDGEVVAEGPVTTDRDAVFRAAHLLDELVGGFEAPPEYRASGGLRLVIARGLGTLDLPPYPSLEDFRAALVRFASLDVRDTARNLFTDWIRTRPSRDPLEAPPSLTISDVRRARRATGLTLHDVAHVAGVPPARLRDLEWGDMRNWPADAEGRDAVLRYARATGLDADLVLSIAWPLIEEAASAAGASVLDAEPKAATALVPSGPQALAPIALPAANRAPARGPRRWGATATVVMLLAALVTFVPAAQRAPETRTTLEGAEAVTAPKRQPAAAVRVAAPPRARALKAARPAVARTAPAARVASSARARAPKAARPTAARKAPTHILARGQESPEDLPDTPPRTPFLEKGLFRIVIK